MSVGVEAPAVVFGRERVVDVWDEIVPLLKDHWREVAHYRDVPLDPDKEFYHKADEFGRVRVFTARKGDRLVGYAIYFVGPEVHYRSLKQATQDLVFVSKEHRGFGVAFMRWCDERLREEGVDTVLCHVKAAHDYGVVFERMGYELVDKVYYRRLA